MKDIRNLFNVDLPRCKGMNVTNAPERIWNEAGWVLEEKMDGIRCSLQLGGTGSLLIGRNRQDFLKGRAQAKEFRNQNKTCPYLAQVKFSELDGTMLDGELTWTHKDDGLPDEDTVRRIQNREYVGYTTWTTLFHNWKDIRPFSESSRRVITQCIVNYINDPKVRLIEQVPATKENLQKFFDRRLEGAIAKNLNKPIPVGQIVNPWYWKLKADDRRTVDAFIIGVTQAKGGGSGITGVKPVYNGKAASFVVGMLKKKARIYGPGLEIVEVGKACNLPKDAIEDGWITHLEALSPESWKYYGKVIEMQVSGWDGKRFRFPRFVKWRTDKGYGDCQFELQVGGE